jgi:hypothetical protein
MLYQGVYSHSKKCSDGQKLSKSQENLDEVSKISNLLMESQIAF